MIRFVSKPRTICYKCKHFLNLEPGSVRADVWYNHRCLVHPLERRINPVTGEETAVVANDFGQVVACHADYDYCRTHNDGDCARYEPKED